MSTAGTATSAVPYGSWVSPLSPAQAAAGSARFGGLAISGAAVLWVESRPDDDGRATILRADETTAPAEFAPRERISARSRVNEYGGGSMWAHGDPTGHGSLYWVSSDTQCLHAIHDGGISRVLTPTPPVLRAWRHAAGVVVPDGRWLVCERELHVDLDGSELPEAVNDLVAVRADGVGKSTVVRLVGPDDEGGGDFVAAPTLSPDGTALAWLRWDHPDMPWDAAELWAATLVLDEVVTAGDTATPRPLLGGPLPGAPRLGAPRLVAPRRIAGGRADRRAHALGRAVSVCLPEWSPDGRLWWCDDSTDWWHLHAADTDGLPAEGSGDAAVPLMPGVSEEVGEPRWVSGGCRYGFTGDGRVVVAASSGGLDSLYVVDPSTGERHALPGPAFTAVETLAVRGDVVAVIAGAADRPTSVWRLDLGRGTATDLRSPTPPLDPGWISAATPISFPTAPSARTGGGPTEAHALFYPPRSGDHRGPEGELPPLVVRIHGGPTAAARPEFSTSVQFWTTRGFAVVDVNYRGSTGFGRRYRDLLRGEWGLSDVEDCIAAARHLGELGLVDPLRCVIRGGSAGGFTTLAALCFQQQWGHGSTFSAGCSLYGVTDLAALAADTHKFESRYLDGLVGPLPQAAEVYRARSPLFHAEQFTQPVLLLQGAEDRIVPPSQAEVLVRALSERGVPHAYVLFRDEGHGFLMNSSIVRALETELGFYGTVLGFTPAGDLPDVPLH